MVGNLGGGNLAASGDVLPDVVGAHSHTIDALRYALQPMIRTGNSGWLRFVAQELEEINNRREAAG